MILRARFVLPFAGPPVENARIVIRGSRIAAVTAWEQRSLSRRNVVDLGEVLVLPGLVNAHCHLDYTDMAGHFPPPKRFTDWLKSITETKSGWDYADYAASWRRGAEMLAATGTTTVGDIEAVPELLPEAWTETSLRVISFLEMIGITNRRRPQEILNETLRLIRRLPHGRSWAALSPHAPYSTLPELLRLSAGAARRHRLPVSIHVAESLPEFEMFTRRQGEMFEWLARSTRDMSDCGGVSPVRHLANCRLLGRNVLAIHLNYLAKGDLSLLARSGTHVVHCPRSHYYFGHDPFPLAQLLRAGVNVSLGTDSLCSVCKTRGQPLELNMFEEMRSLKKAFPQLRSEMIFRMATVNGAKALGLEGQAGEISRYAWADLITIPWKGGRHQKALDHALHFSGTLPHRMIAGRWLGATPFETARPALRFPSGLRKSTKPAPVPAPRA